MALAKRLIHTLTNSCQSVSVFYEDLVVYYKQKMHEFPLKISTV